LDSGLGLGLADQRQTAGLITRPCEIRCAKASVGLQSDGPWRGDSIEPKFCNDQRRSGWHDSSSIDSLRRNEYEKLSVSWN